MPTATEPSASRARVLVACVVLYLAALGVRLWGVGCMLPHMPEPDGTSFLAQLEAARVADVGVEPLVNVHVYPTLVARVAGLMTWERAPLDASAPLAEHLARASADFLALRRASALLSAFLAPLVMLLALRFVAFGPALLAGVLAAASSLHVWFSAQARPHGSAVCAVVLCVLAAIDLANRNRPRDYLVAGIALALAVGTLQSGVLLAAPLLVALCVRDERGAPHSLARAALGLVVAALVALFLYPFAFQETPDAQAGVTVDEGGGMNLSGHRISLALFNGRGFAELAGAFARYDPWIATIGAVGVVVLLAASVRGLRGLDRSRKVALAIVVAHAVTYAVVFGMYQRTYQRFAIPLVPYAALAAAGGASIAWSAIAKRTPSWFGGLLGALLVLPACVLALGVAHARAGDDTATRCARWIASNVREGERVAIVPAIELPLLQDDEALAANAELMDLPGRPWFRYQRARHGEGGAIDAKRFRLVQMPMQDPETRRSIVAEPDAYVRSLGAEYAVVEVYERRGFPLLQAVRRGCRSLGQRVARFEASAQDGEELDDLPLFWQDDEYRTKEAWALRALRSQGFGPTLEVYRITR